MNEQNDPVKTAQPTQADDGRIERQLEAIKETLAGHDTTLALITENVKAASDKVDKVNERLDRDPLLRRVTVLSFLAVFIIVSLVAINDHIPVLDSIKNLVCSVIKCSDATAQTNPALPPTTD